MYLNFKREIQKMYIHSADNKNMIQNVLRIKGKKSPFWLSIEELMPDWKDPERVELLRVITGVQQPTVSRWKTGAEPIGNRNALKIAKKLRCNVHWLQTHEGDRHIDSNDNPFLLRIRNVLYRLSSDDMEELAAIAELKARKAPQ